MVINMKRFALTLLVATTGCSLALDDVRNAPVDAEFCDESHNTQNIRDGHFRFLDMAAHTNHLTVISVVSQPGPYRDPMTGTTSQRPRVRSRATISPSVAAATHYAIRDGSCVSTEATGMTMDFVARNFIPSNIGSPGGPYRIDFWSDATGDRMLTPRDDMGGGDHIWTRPVCSDGDVLFTHNTGFDAPLGAVPTGGDFQLVLSEDEVVQAVFPMLGPAARIPIVNALRQQPMVVEVNWQGLTVGYMRTIRACDTNPVGVRGVIDAGAEHTVTVYWDFEHNGRYDESCDPICNFTTNASGNPWEFSPGLTALGLACSAAANSNFATDCHEANP